MGSRMGTGVQRKTPGQDELSHLIWNLDEEPEEYDNLNMTGQMFNMWQKQKRQKQHLPEATVEEKGEFQTLEESIKMATKDLKGGKFVVDKAGNVIALHTVRPEALPPFALDVTPKIINGVRQPPPPKSAGTAKHADGEGHHGAQHAHAGGKKKKVRVAGSRAMDTSFFTAANTLSTALAGGDYITTINPGVVLRVDDKVLEGPPAPMDPTKPTRQQYMDRSMSQQSLHSGDSMASGMLRQGSTDTFNHKLSADEQQKHRLPISMQFPDVDALEGARRVEARPPEPTKVVASEGSAVAFELTHSTHAGRNIASTVLPGRPDARQHNSVAALSGGVDKIHPRDRDVPLSQVPVHDRKRLPAPPLGQTTGHGLSPTKRNNTNQTSQGQLGQGSLAGNSKLSWSVASNNSKG